MLSVKPKIIEQYVFVSTDLLETLTLSAKNVRLEPTYASFYQNLFYIFIHMESSITEISMHVFIQLVAKVIQNVR